MWIKETPEGLHVDIEGFMAEVGKYHGDTDKKFKTVEEESIDIGDINGESLIFKVAGRYFNLVAVKETSNIDEILKENYEEKLSSEKERILAKCNAAVEEFKAYTKHVLEVGEQEISELQRRLRNSSPMPEISYAHAKAGLSVVKGENGNMIWLFRTVYNPQYVEDRQLSKSMVKKLLTPMIIMITTRKEEIIGVETKTLALEAFRHYHRLSAGSRRRSPGGDCWGNWKWARTKFSTPDDILRIAREASNVLSTINPRSIATRDPVGLPRFQTVESHIIRLVDSTDLSPNTATISVAQERAGLHGLQEARGGGWNVTTEADQEPRH